MCSLSRKNLISSFKWGHKWLVNFNIFSILKHSFGGGGECCVVQNSETSYEILYINVNIHRSSGGGVSGSMTETFVYIGITKLEWVLVWGLPS